MLRLFVALQAWAQTLREEERGATAVEYGVMVALIAAGIILAVTALRDALINTFNSVTTALP